MDVKNKGEKALLKRILLGLFRSHEQTGEKAKDPLLKTRYYKVSKDRAWESVIYALKNTSGYKVLHEIKNIGEIVVEKKTATGRRQDITISLFAINPVQSAIDIYSASRGSLGDLGSNYRTILEIFKIIDAALDGYQIRG